jgi:hypothetical protein
MKVCSICKVEKPLERFSKRADRPSGVQSKCKDCEREIRRKYYKPHHDTRRKLKISDGLFEQLMKTTNCYTCDNCNTALGLVGDNIDTLSRMINYLNDNHTDPLQTGRDHS